MKVLEEHYSHPGGLKEVGLEYAIRGSLTPGAYSYEGTLEGIKARAEKTNDMLCRLVLFIVDKNIASCDELQKILGHGYTVEK